MFYTASPSPLPVPIYTSDDDCKKGSRDCFPDNTVGGAIEDSSTTGLETTGLKTEKASISDLIQDLGQFKRPNQPTP